MSTPKPLEKYLIGARLILTEQCNENCPHCFNKNVRERGVMDADKCMELITILGRHHRRRPNTRLLLMGGEPLLHPRFMDIVERSRQEFLRTAVFTNGTLVADVMREHPSLAGYAADGRVGFIINGYTFRLENFMQFQEHVPGVAIHYVIMKRRHERTFSELCRAMEALPGKIQVTLSCDTTADLFDPGIMTEYRQLWIGTIEKVAQVAARHRVRLFFDHKLPVCFYSDSIIKRLTETGLNQVVKQQVNCCTNEGYVGLVDTDFNLLFCNQTRIHLGSLLREDGSFLPYAEMIDLIRNASAVKKAAIRERNPECAACNALDMCLTGCYYNALDAHHAPGAARAERA